MTRRSFLTTGCAACAAATTWLGLPGWAQSAGAPPRVRIRVVYALHGAQQTGPDWPNKHFNFQPVMDWITGELTRRCRGFEFLPSLANGPEAARKLLESDHLAGGIDGYLVLQMNCWNRVVQTFAESGQPVLYADFQYGGSGGFLVYNAGFLREGVGHVGYVASSRLDDLVAAVACFAKVKESGRADTFADLTTRVRLARTPEPSDRPALPDPMDTLAIDECVARMKASKILAVRGQESGPAPSLFEIPVVHVPFAEVNAAWTAADTEASRAVADRWEQGAILVEGVSRETLDQSAAMYLALKAVMQRHGANAITVNCLGGFYGGHIHAYPCLGFHELLNEGLVGACECDVRSTATMVAFTTLTRGRPGYISDPVIDTAKRQIIYAHCVASNRALGPEGPANPYQILTHSEDRQGASVRSLLPLGYLTTTLEVDQGRREILMHQAHAVANDSDDRACRTKLAAEPVGDLERLFTQWDHWGWHRVTFYGDLKIPVYALADAIGWKVVEEA
jgi:hypothetical protein